MGPEFLTAADIIAIHSRAIDQFGGSHGMRDLALLESAAAQPQASFGGRYLHEDVFEMAAAYAFHLVQNHPFVDGNKRIGAASALVFLRINGITVKADENAFTDLILDVAQGAAEKPAIAAFFREHSTPPEA